MPDYVAPPPPKEALAYFRAKKLKPAFSYRDVWREEHAAAFTVAKAMQLDVLNSIRSELEKALADGRTFESFKKDLQPTLEKLGWWGRKDMTDPLTGKTREVQLGSPRRLKVIYRTNMRMARAAGQWSRIQRTKKLRPYLLYQLGPSKEHRLEHTRYNGLVLPVDDPFWQTHFPPNGWGCKCFVRHISTREADQLGGESESPEVQTSEWINKRTGEVSQVSDGIDPGFDYNPGIAHSTYLQRVITRKLDASTPELSEGLAAALVQGAAFRQFVQKPEGLFPVAGLGRDLKQRLNAEHNTVLLSAETLAKQQQNHPELTLQEYQLLPSLIAQGKVLTQGDQKLVFYRRQGRLYKAVLKVTGDRSELYLVSYYRLSEDRLDRELQRGEVLRDWQED